MCLAYAGSMPCIVTGHSCCWFCHSRHVIKGLVGVLGQVFELGGDVVSPQLAHSLTRLIAEGAGEEDEQADTELRAQAVASYLDLLDKPKLSAVLLKVGMHSIWTTEAVW